MPDGGAGRAPAGTAWLHGYTMTSGLYAPLWDRLPGSRHVGIDLPGHGTAAGEPLPGSLAALAALVAARLGREGCRTLVGMSFGSCVALQVALDFPEALDRLVLAAPTLAGTPDDEQAREKYLAMARLYRLLGPGRELTRLWMAEPPGIFRGLRDRPEAFAAVEAVIAQHPFAELRTGGMRALSASVHTPAQLATLRLPVLVVIGAQDLTRFQDNAAALRATVPSCTLRVVPDTGHLPLLEDPSASADVLQPFLAETPHPGGAAVA